jgi:hypothetical protein
MGLMQYLDSVSTALASQFLTPCHLFKDVADSCGVTGGIGTFLVSFITVLEAERHMAVVA